MCGCVQGSKPLYVFSTLLYVPAVDVMVYVNAHVFRFGLLVWGDSWKVSQCGPRWNHVLGPFQTPCKALESDMTTVALLCSGQSFTSITMILFYYSLRM